MSNIDPMLMRQIIMDHYDYPRNKELTDNKGYMSRHMASDSCIDDITVQTKISDGKIDDIRFDGVACTISTASTSIMSELLKGKTTQEAKEIMDNYFTEQPISRSSSGALMQCCSGHFSNSTSWRRPTVAQKSASSP